MPDPQVSAGRKADASQPKTCLADQSYVHSKHYMFRRPSQTPLTPQPRSPCLGPTTRIKYRGRRAPQGRIIFTRHHPIHPDSPYTPPSSCFGALCSPDVWSVRRPARYPTPRTPIPPASHVSFALPLAALRNPILPPAPSHVHHCSTWRISIRRKVPWPVNGRADFNTPSAR